MDTQSNAPASAIECRILAHLDELGTTLDTVFDACRRESETTCWKLFHGVSMMFACFLQRYATFLRTGEPSEPLPLSVAYMILIERSVLTLADTLDSLRQHHEAARKSPTRRAEPVVRCSKCGKRPAFADGKQCETCRAAGRRAYHTRMAKPGMRDIMHATWRARDQRRR